MNAAMTWTDLFAKSRAVHERKLRMATKEAGQSGAGDLAPIISGTDDSLAAIAIVVGPAAARDFPPAIAPVVAKIGRQLEMFRDGVADRGALELLSLVSICESIGAPIKPPDYDVDYRFKKFLSNKVFSRTEKMTVALLALDRGRVADAQLIVDANARGGADVVGDPMAIVKTAIAALRSREASVQADLAFDAYVRAFPSSLAEERTEWRQLMLAARLVLGILGGNPAGEIAESLHGRIKSLAAEGST